METENPEPKTEYGKFYKKLKNATPYWKTIEKKSQDGKSGNFAKVQYIDFEKKNVRINLQDYVVFKDYINTINIRLIAYWHYFNKIKEDCEIKEISEKEAKRKINKELIVTVEFIANAEYFIFSIQCCLDIVAQVINIFYVLNIKKFEVSLSKVIFELKRNKINDDFTNVLFKHYDNWIKEFSKIRNNMTHHGIIKINSNITHLPEEDKIIFTKRNIKARIDEFITITKPLPIYFEEIKKKMNELIEEFYKLLNGFDITT